jgi:hypothetical protein
MKTKVKLGKVIGGFAYTYAKSETSEKELIVMETFAKTQDFAKAKLLRSKRYFYNKDRGRYRLFSVQMIPMHEVDLNLYPTDEFPVLDDDDEFEPEVPKPQMIGGRLVIEDPFYFPPQTKIEKRKQ